MGHFYQTKGEAQEAAERFKDDYRVREVVVQFEPYGGWVIVLFPHYIDLSEYADVAEIKDGVKRKLTGKLGTKPVPVTKDDGSPLRARTRNPGGYSPDATWKVMDELHSVGKDRDAIIAELVSSGIDSKKASRETRHWMKARGLWKK